MKKIICLLFISLVFNPFCFSVAQDKVNKRQYSMVEKNTPPKEPEISFGTDEEDLIPVNVKNEFDEEIKVKLDTNREYPVGAHEWITLGKRKSGRYTLTVYNKKGDFVDNLTKNIDNKNKFVLNKDTVSNSDKITGLTTGQKVAITAGAVGAAALGTALIHKALESGEQTSEPQYIPPPSLPEPRQQIGAAVEKVINAFASGGKVLKVLNPKYSQVTFIVEGTDGNPIGNNWIIPKAVVTQKPEPLIFNSEKITINPNQTIRAVLPDGIELQRIAFELDVDLLDGGYVWVLK